MRGRRGPRRRAILPARNSIVFTYRNRKSVARLSEAASDGPARRRREAVRRWGYPRLLQPARFAQDVVSIALALRTSVAGEMAPGEFGELQSGAGSRMGGAVILFRHVHEDAQLTGGGQMEQLPGRRVRARVDQCADIRVARGDDAIKGRRNFFVRLQVLETPMTAEAEASTIAFLALRSPIFSSVSWSETDCVFNRNCCSGRQSESGRA